MPNQKPFHQLSRSQIWRMLNKKSFKVKSPVFRPSKLIFQKASKNMLVPANNECEPSDDDDCNMLDSAEETLKVDDPQEKYIQRDFAKILNKIPLSDNSDSDEFDIGESSSEVEEKLKLDLINWSSQFLITNIAISALLCILKSHRCFSSLPVDARTLLNTPRPVETDEVTPGRYHHIGIMSNIKLPLTSVHSYVTSIYLISVLMVFPCLKVMQESFGLYWVQS